MLIQVLKKRSKINYFLMCLKHKKISILEIKLQSIEKKSLYIKNKYYIFK